MSSFFVIFFKKYAMANFMHTIAEATPNGLTYYSKFDMIRLERKLKLRDQIPITAKRIAELMYIIWSKRATRFINSLPTNDIRYILHCTMELRMSQDLEKVLPFKKGKQYLVRHKIKFLDKSPSEFITAVSELGKSYQTWFFLNLRPGDTYSIVDGKLVLYSKKSGENVPCVWYEQGKGYGVVKKIGFFNKKNLTIT